MEVGIPQGRPESPALFIAALEFVMKPLLASWAARGLGFRFVDGLSPGV